MPSNKPYFVVINDLTEEEAIDIAEDYSTAKIGRRRGKRGPNIGRTNLGARY